MDKKEIELLDREMEIYNQGLREGLSKANPSDKTLQFMERLTDMQKGVMNRWSLTNILLAIMLLLLASNFYFSYHTKIEIKTVVEQLENLSLINGKGKTH